MIDLSSVLRVSEAIQEQLDVKRSRLWSERVWSLSFEEAGVVAGEKIATREPLPPSWRARCGFGIMLSSMTTMHQNATQTNEYGRLTLDSAITQLYLCH